MDEQDRRCDRAGDPGAAADHGHRQARHHDRKFEDLRRDDADGVDVERAGGAGIERTEQKGGKAQRPAVEADRRGDDGVLAQHQEGQPPGAARRLPGGKRAERREAPDHGEKRQAARQRRAEEDDAGHAGYAVGAAGDVLPVHRDEQHNLADPQRCESEVMRLEA